MLNRRNLLAAVLGSPVAAIAGCSRRKLPARGEMLSPSFSIGHQIRDSNGPAHGPANLDSGSFSGVKRSKADVVVVGGGIAGLTAARRLLQQGIDDFVVLEMEPHAGGTARSDTTGAMKYPWGAHYVPAPTAANHDLIELFDEMGVVSGILGDGTPVVSEEYLCRQPEERVFVNGRWQDGLYPFSIATDEDLKQLEAFESLVNDWVDRRDEKGKRMFAIPTVRSSHSPEAMALDRISIADWMNQHQFDSAPLRWLVDYSCRDDYGLTIDQTSAWAGLFYFASRRLHSGAESQQVITWPEGNGRIVNHLVNLIGDRLKSGHAVFKIRDDIGQGLDQHAEVLCMDVQTKQHSLIEAKQVIFAGSQYLVPHLVEGLPPKRATASKSIPYGAWLVANVHLSDRPEERTIGGQRSMGMAWDNVIYDSRSLGYVVSTHQTGLDHGPTVLTWYYPLTDQIPANDRKKLLAQPWETWADLVLSDLSVPHPNLDSLVERLDVMRWGHAMVQPRVGLISGNALKVSSKPIGRIHFANTDLSGVALMEEAFANGKRAADAVGANFGKHLSPKS